MKLWLKIQAFWYVMLCQWANSSLYFKVSYCLYLIRQAVQAEVLFGLHDTVDEGNINQWNTVSY